MQMNCSNIFFIDLGNKLGEELFITKMSVSVIRSPSVVLTWELRELHLILTYGTTMKKY